MSSNDELFEKTPVTGQNVGDVISAFAIVVHIIKEQPAFDAALFDQRVQAILDKKAPELSPIIRAILENTVDLSSETPTTL